MFQTQFLGQCDQRSVVFMSFFLSFKHDLIFVSSVMCLVIDVLILAGGHDISQQPVLIKLQWMALIQAKTRLKSKFVKINIPELLMKMQQIRMSECLPPYFSANIDLIFVCAAHYSSSTELRVVLQVFFPGKNPPNHFSCSWFLLWYNSSHLLNILYVFIQVYK